MANQPSQQPQPASERPHLDTSPQEPPSPAARSPNAGPAGAPVESEEAKPAAREPSAGSATNARPQKLPHEETTADRPSQAAEREPSPAPTAAEHGQPPKRAETGKAAEVPSDNSSVSSEEVMMSERVGLVKVDQVDEVEGRPQTDAQQEKPSPTRAETSKVEPVPLVQLSAEVIEANVSEGPETTKVVQVDEPQVTRVKTSKTFEGSSPSAGASASQSRVRTYKTVEDPNESAPATAASTRTTTINFIKAEGSAPASEAPSRAATMKAVKVADPVPTTVPPSRASIAHPVQVDDPTPSTVVADELPPKRVPTIKTVEIPVDIPIDVPVEATPAETVGLINTAVVESIPAGLVEQPTNPVSVQVINEKHHYDSCCCSSICSRWCRNLSSTAERAKVTAKAKVG